MKNCLRKLKMILLEEKYDNIFLPLCFGPTLSDYNGLRLATHIRCTDTPNNVSTYLHLQPNKHRDDNWKQIL